MNDGANGLEASNRPPNIVFVMADQLGARHLGAYGSPVGSTPTLDRLAAQGACFNRAYASVAVCAPNRATILTGRSPEVHGLTVNNLELNPHTPTYAHALRTRGYRLGCFGKLHQTSMARALPESAAHLGFHEARLTEDPRRGPWLEWIRTEHPEHFEAALATSWPVPYLSGAERVAWQRAFDRVLAPRKAASRWALMYPSPLPAELQQTTYITDCGLDFMARQLLEHPEAPFFCHLSYVAPHDPYDPPDPYARMFSPDAMPPPLPAQWLGRAPQTLLKKQRFAGFEAIADDPAAIAELRAFYHGSLRLIDDQLGRVVSFLQAHGLWENTVLVFTTDHGELLGDHGLITKGVAHYDAGIRCPLIVCGAGIAPGRVVERLVCSLDFFPTFCAWAGMPDPWPHEGRSFAADCLSESLRGPPPDPWPEVTVEADYAPALRASVRSVVTEEGWRLTIFGEAGYGELFDLRADPDEQHNLYFSPDAKKLELFERHARAYFRRAEVPQHRALPRVSGRAMRTGPGLTLVDDVLELPDFEGGRPSER